MRKRRDEVHIRIQRMSVELIYSGETALLQKFLTEAVPGRETDSHAAASVRISTEFSDIPQNDLRAIQGRALHLLKADNEEMDRKYQSPVRLSD